MRHRADHNQTAIVRALQKLGAVVEVTTAMGNGFPDLVVSWLGEWHLIEVKSAKGKLLESQKKFHEKHSRASVYMIRSVDDVVRWASVVRRSQKYRRIA